MRCWSREVIVAAEFGFGGVDDVGGVELTCATVRLRVWFVSQAFTSSWLSARNRTLVQLGSVGLLGCHGRMAG